VDPRYDSTILFAHTMLDLLNSGGYLKDSVEQSRVPISVPEICDVYFLGSAVSNISPNDEQKSGSDATLNQKRC
jgi:hypothetical protein